MINLAVAAAVVGTLPMTVPVLQDHVLGPLAQRLTGRLVESVTPPAPASAPAQPQAPAP